MGGTNKKLQEYTFFTLILVELTLVTYRYFFSEDILGHIGSGFLLVIVSICILMFAIYFCIEKDFEYGIIGLLFAVIGFFL
jgi:hypothetical protein